MKPIHKIIGYTEHQYEMLLLQVQINWADLYGKGSPRKMQILVTNRQINNWFHKEIKKLLQQFREDLRLYENETNITCKERCKLFVTNIAKIYDIYPGALLTEHKALDKHPIKNTFNNN